MSFQVKSEKVDQTPEEAPPAIRVKEEVHDVVMEVNADANAEPNQIDIPTDIQEHPNTENDVDPVVKEIDVYLAKSLANKVIVLQVGYCLNFSLFYFYL